jgi:hypothetical protein
MVGVILPAVVLAADLSQARGSQASGRIALVIMDANAPR